MAHLCCIGLVLSLFMLLVTLSMLTNRAGCYNVREKKLIVRKLTSTVNSCGIDTFSVRGEGQRFFDSLKCMNTIFPVFQMTVTVLSRLKWHNICFHCSDVSCDIYNGVPEFLMTTTFLSRLRLHYTFTFSAHGESTGAAGDRGKLE